MAVVDDVAAVEHEIRTKGEDAVGAAPGHLRIALGVAEDAEGPGVVRSGHRLKGGDFRAGQVAGGVAGDDAVEIAGVRLQAGEGDRLQGARFVDGDGGGQRLGRSVLDRQGGGAGHFGHDGHGVGGGGLQVRLDDELEDVVDRLLPADESGVGFRDAGDFRGPERAGVEFHLLQRAFHGMMFVVVDIRAHGQAAGGGVQNVARGGGRFALRPAVDEQAHRRPVVGADDMVPTPGDDRAARGERGQRPVAVVGAGGGNSEGERLFVVPEHPALFEPAVVLNEAGDPAIGAGVVQQHPRRHGKLARRQQRRGGATVGRDQQPVAASVEPEPLGRSDGFQDGGALDSGGRLVGEIGPLAVFDRVGAGGKVPEQTVLDLVGVGGQRSGGGERDQQCQGAEKDGAAVLSHRRQWRNGWQEERRNPRGRHRGLRRRPGARAGSWRDSGRGRGGGHAPPSPARPRCAS